MAQNLDSSVHCTVTVQAAVECNRHIPAFGTLCVYSFAASVQPSPRQFVCRCVVVVAHFPPSRLASVHITATQPVEGQRGKAEASKVFRVVGRGEVSVQHLKRRPSEEEAIGSRRGKRARRRGGLFSCRPP